MGYLWPKKNRGGNYLTYNWENKGVQAVDVCQYYFKVAPHGIMKQLKKKLNGNYTKLLHAVLNKSWRQYPIKQQLYSHLSPILQTI